MPSEEYTFFINTGQGNCIIWGSRRKGSVPEAVEKALTKISADD
jgi:hypothetical protein